MSIIYSKKYNLHNNPNHIENKNRTEAILNILHEKGIIKHLEVYKPKRAKIDDLKKVHELHYINYIKEFCKKGGGYLDFDTYATSYTYDVASLAAGGAIEASKLIINGKKWVYSISRPPGHHATKNKAMGFCIFNNLAIGLENLRNKFKNFLILDFDLHYGNGTAEIYYEDPSVLYISIHQDPKTIFPSCGFIDEIGKNEGEGYNINIPMPPNSDDNDYIWILSEIIPPIIDDFKPEIILIEAGFDAHKRDPLGSINLTEKFYAWIAKFLRKFNLPIMCVLEGGYNLKALKYSNLMFILYSNPELLGMDQFSNLRILDGFKEAKKVKIRVKKLYSEIKSIISNFFKI